jgi:hypothetical protein
MNKPNDNLFIFISLKQPIYLLINTLNTLNNMNNTLNNNNILNLIITFEQDLALAAASALYNIKDELVNMPKEEIVDIIVREAWGFLAAEEVKDSPSKFNLIVKKSGGVKAKKLPDFSPNTHICSVMKGAIRCTGTTKTSKDGHMVCVKCLKGLKEGAKFGEPMLNPKLKVKTAAKEVKADAKEVKADAKEVKADVKPAPKAKAAPKPRVVNKK